MNRNEKNRLQMKPSDVLSDAQNFSAPPNPQALLPGLKPVLESLENHAGNVDLVLCRDNLNGREVQKIQKLCQQHAVRFRRVPEDVLNSICRREGKGEGVVSHQGIVARLLSVACKSLEDLFSALSTSPLPLILALDQVKDPGNLGTLARTLYTLGGAGILLPQHNSAGPGPQARRSAAGALDLLPVARVTNLGHALDSCEEHGLTIYGAAAPSTKSLNAFTSPISLPAVLVLGSEERGIRPDVLKRCSALLSIPQARDFDSLNVAQAGAILLGIMAMTHHSS